MNLNGILVVDASTVLAGPSVGTFLAELGAQVVKVEHPKHKDVTRSWKLPSEDSSSSVSAYFSSINYKKDYQSIDLKSENGRSQFLGLIERADILITNFKKGDAEKFKIEDERLLELNPRLIHGKINGYGEESDRVAYDLILQAESGFMSINGTPESGPVKMPVALIDVLAAHHLKEAILLALYNREKTGKGIALSVSLYEAAVSSLVNQASNYLMTGQVPQRIGSLHPNIAPYGELFETKDGVTITLAIGSNTHFERLCEVLGMDQFAQDERFDSVQQRVINRGKLYELLIEVIKNLESAELIQSLRELNVPAGAVLSIDQVMQSELSQSLIREELIDEMETKRISSVVIKSNGNPIT